ncbi:hypothetical protein HDU84_000068 [Entophlyctis sp. JEL0112]|nr:hypothetical protein HDU84_000068 [Entophlyctis sp. JEL0112]
MGDAVHDHVVVPALYPLHGHPRRLGPVERFALSALAPAVRLQLQGQKAKSKGSSAATTSGGVVYRNSFDAIFKIIRHEGIQGIQKGLFPAILKEGSKNFFRIGMYDPFMHILHNPALNPDHPSAPPWKRMLAGALCGVMGAFACNPFELVKTRLQSQVSAANTHQAVGHQFEYRGTWDALVKTVTADGVKGLYRGSTLSMARSFVGSGANLTTYSMMKEDLIMKRGWKDDWILDMIAGMGSGIMSCVFMNPIDVVRTRYYNQSYVNGKGTLYSSGFDAIKHIVKVEGVASFYKGFTTHFLRIGPHFCLTFVFLGMFRRQLSEAYHYLDMREAFLSFDKDGNGFIDRTELTAVMRNVLPRPNGVSDGDYDRAISSATSRVLDSVGIVGDNGQASFRDYPRMAEEIQRIYVERRNAAGILFKSS